jgi:hypothetical protein
MIGKRTEMIKIYLAYSDGPEDIDLYNQLSKHIKTSILKDMCAITDKHSALASNTDLQNTKKMVVENDVIIAMISVDFLGEKGMIDLLEESNLNKKRLLPIIARDCNYDDWEVFTPYLEHIVPQGNTIMGMFSTATDKSQVFTDIVEEISDFVLGKFDKITLHASWPFLIISIVCLLVGCGAALYTYTNTQDFMLTVLVLILFMTITVVSASRYIILSSKIKWV